MYNQTGRFPNLNASSAIYQACHCRDGFRHRDDIPARPIDAECCDEYGYRYHQPDQPE
jgi:hypothetical protein